jgi:hypothetical protein
MVIRRSAGTLAVAAALVLSVSLVAQKKDDKKQDEAQKKEIQSTVTLVDQVAADQPAPNEFGLAWVHEDVLKAAGNKQYVPFTVSFDPSKATGASVVLYWRAVSKSAAAPAPAPGTKDGKKDDKKDSKDGKKRNDFAYEDVTFIPVSPGTSPRLSRSFTLPAGNYDVYVAIKDPASAVKNAPAPKASVIKQAVTVPDFWNGELNTSSVMVTQRIDPLPAPLTPQQQVERPYAMGTMELVPLFDLKYSKKGELSTFMLIYNPKVDSANKPDISVEYNFYAKSGGTEKFYNKTNPQSLNAQTLPPQFDLAAGHQLQTGQAVPLASFPEGDYRLEIKITDKVSNKTLTRDVNFTVTAS